MNEAIELHDSTLASCILVNGSALISFSPACIHRSAGRPGCDAGSCWLQATTLSISAASVSAAVELPVRISGGSLRIESDLHENCVPAEGTFDGPIELSLVLETSAIVTIQGQQLKITRHGEPTYVEEFSPRDSKHCSRM